MRSLYLLTLAFLSTGCVDIDLKDTGGEDGGVDGIDIGGDGGSDDTGGSEDTGGLDPVTTAFTVLDIPSTGTQLYDVVYAPSIGRYYFSSPTSTSSRGSVWGVVPTTTVFADAETIWQGATGDYLGVNLSVLGSTHLGTSTAGTDGRGRFYAIPFDEVSGAVAGLTTAGSIEGDTVDAYFGTASTVSGSTMYVSQTGGPSFSVWSVPAAILTEGPSAGSFAGVAEFAVDPTNGRVAMDLVASPNGLLAVSNGGVSQFVGTTNWYRQSDGTVVSGLPVDDADVFAGRGFGVTAPCYGRYLERSDEYAVTCEGTGGFDTTLINPATGAQIAFLEGVSDVLDAVIGTDQVRLFATQTSIRIQLADGTPVREDALPFGEDCDARLAGDGAGNFAVMCRESNLAAFGALGG